MIRFFLVEIVLPLAVLLFIRYLVRAIFAGIRSAAVQARANAGGATAAATPETPVRELKKDPVCGTYVSTGSGFSRNAGGQMVYFCSKECRDRFKG